MIEKIYKNYQQMKASKEPFNNELIYIRKDDQIYDLLKSIFEQYKNDPRVSDVRCFWESDEPMSQIRKERDGKRASRRIEKTRVNVFKYEIDIWVLKDDMNEGEGSKNFNQGFAKALKKERVKKQSEYLFREIFEKKTGERIKYDEIKYKKITIYGKLFMPKLINNLFYMIEGSRYFTRMQIVDKIIYPVDNNSNKKITGVNRKMERSGERTLSLTTRLPKMQLSLSNTIIYEFDDVATSEPVYVPYFNVLLFNRNHNIIQILLSKYAFNMLTKEYNLTEPTKYLPIVDVYDDNEVLIARGHRNLTDVNGTIIDSVNDFLGTTVVIEDQPVEDENYYNLRLQYKNYFGPYVIIDKTEFKENVLSRTYLAGLQKMFESYCDVIIFRESDNLDKMDKHKLEALGGTKITTKEVENNRIDEVGFKYVENEDKSRVVSKEDLLQKPALMCHLLGGVVFKKNDYAERLHKTFQQFLSMERLNDESLLDEYMTNEDKLRDKEPNLLTFLKYLIVNYNDIKKINTSNVYNKRVKISENVIGPIRVLTSQVLFALIKENNLDAERAGKIFKTIKDNKNMLIKDMLKNDLILYDNSSNDSVANFFTNIKYTMSGSGGLNSKRVPFKYRRIDPSYVGNLSLVASSATNPGITGTLVPFAKIDLDKKTSSFEFDKSNNEK